jgi:hypothetical protein
LRYATTASVKVVACLYFHLPGLDVSELQYQALACFSRVRAELVSNFLVKLRLNVLLSLHLKERYFLRTLKAIGYHAKNNIAIYRH